jgi:hypothetical protein
MPIPVEELVVTEVHPVDIGTRRELLADGHLVDRLRGSARLVLHHPTPGEIVMVHDAPWEGNTCAYHTIFRDGGRVRMFYRGSQGDPESSEQGHRPVTCYAESDDGVHWRKPSLNLVAFRGSTDTNILWEGVGSHNFTPFKDSNPDADPQARYKAVGGLRRDGGLFAFASADGIHWRRLGEGPIITAGTFDSQNVAFWDAARSTYRAYVRDFRGGEGPFEGVRDIKTCTSEDFLHWTEPVWLDYGDAPETHLYTNQVMPYPRAPHLLIGLPTRFFPDRGSLTESLVMTSRDGQRFRRWDEAWIRPGLNPARWHNRSNYVWYGIVRTPSEVPGAPDVLSFYSNEHYYGQGGGRIRRYTLRMDGFASVRAGYDGGTLVTRPLITDGRRLTLNVATSAAGSVRVELQRVDGKPLPGFALDDCDPFYGDAVDHTVRWRGSPGVPRLAGRPIRLRVALRDADLYALRFGELDAGR